MESLKSFASDNNAPVHETVFHAMMEANRGDAIGYGDDRHTLAAEKMFREHFGDGIGVFFMFTGTAANVACLAHITRPFQAVVCSDKAHLENDECGAPERFSGCKLLKLPSADGKIRVDQILPLLGSLGFQHHAQPRVISITQATELGTVYRIEEIREIADFAHEHGMYLHMDGARLANAAASLRTSLAGLTVDAGVDVLSFGGTKNGLMAAEAVVFFDPALGEAFEYTRKQSMQLASKMRYISAQFNALLSGGLWLENAVRANAMAGKLAGILNTIPGIQITQPVETNAVFARIPARAIEKLKRKYFFYVWDAPQNEVRWMTAYHTTENDIEQFAGAVKEAMAD